MSVSLRKIFWLYASEDGSGASIVYLLDLACLLFTCLSIYLIVSQFSEKLISFYFSCGFDSRTRRGTEPLALEEPVLTEREEDSEQGDQQGDRHVDQGVALSEEAKKLGNMMSRSFED